MKTTSMYILVFLSGLVIGYMEEEMIHDALTKSKRMKKKMTRNASRMMDQFCNMIE